MALQKRSLTLAGHATSIRLEPEFWQTLETLAEEKRMSLPALINRIDETRENNLASALRVFALQSLKSKIAPAKTS